MYQKNIFVQGKIKWKKIHAVTLKKFDQWSKKNSYKENEKKHSRVRKFPTTHNFSDGPSLRTDFTYNTGVKFHTLKLEAWVFIGFIRNIRTKYSFICYKNFY